MWACRYASVVAPALTSSALAEAEPERSLKLRGFCPLRSSNSTASRPAGADAAGVEARALEVAAKTRLYFLLDTLDNLVKGGRAGKAAGLAASLLNIKPVLRVNDEGIIEPFKKVRGRQQAVAALAQHLAEDSAANGRMRVALLHACCPEQGQELEDAIIAAGADVEWESRGPIGAVIGVYTGPGAIGCAYYPVD